MVWSPPKNSEYGLYPPKNKGSPPGDVFDTFLKEKELRAKHPKEFSQGGEKCSWGRTQTNLPVGGAIRP